MKKRKGKCTNYGPCGLANRQWLQVIPDDGAEFVCAECGAQLEKAEPAPPKQVNRPLRLAIVIAIVVVVLGGMGMAYWLNRMDQAGTLNNMEFESLDDLYPVEDADAAYTFITGEVENGEVDEGVYTEASGVAAGEGEYEEEEGDDKVMGVALDSADLKTLNGVGVVALSYGIYKGEVREGRPHGIGTLYYRSTHRISKYDDRERIAEPGDYVVGEFNGGQLVQGRWFDEKKNQKGIIMIGRAK